MGLLLFEINLLDCFRLNDSVRVERIVVASCDTFNCTIFFTLKAIKRTNTARMTSLNAVFFFLMFFFYVITANNHYLSPGERGSRIFGCPFPCA